MATETATIGTAGPAKVHTCVCTHSENEKQLCSNSTYLLTPTQEEKETPFVQFITQHCY